MFDAVFYVCDCVHAWNQRNLGRERSGKKLSSFIWFVIDNLAWLVPVFIAPIKKQVST